MGMQVHFLENSIKKSRKKTLPALPNLTAYEDFNRSPGGDGVDIRFLTDPGVVYIRMVDANGLRWDKFIFQVYHKSLISWFPWNFNPSSRSKPMAPYFPIDYNEGFLFTHL
jgi:hypothetical protein